MSKKWNARALLLAGTLALGAERAGAQNLFIDTEAPWNHLSGSCCVGAGGTVATIGQRFLVNTDNVMNYFSFWLKQGIGDVGTNMDFDAYIMRWDDNAFHATGPVVWQSTIASPYEGSASSTFQRYDFLTGTLALTQNTRYVAFLTVSNHFVGTASDFIGGGGNNVYADGGYAHMTNAANTTAWTTQFWSTSVDDLAFEIGFDEQISAAPEPATFVLFGSGLAGLGLLRRRTKQR